MHGIIIFIACDAKEYNSSIISNSYTDPIKACGLVLLLIYRISLPLALLLEDTYVEVFLWQFMPKNGLL